MTIFNRLSVRLTAESSEYISNVMSGSPLDIDISAFSVEIITTLDAITAKPDNVYDAYCLNLKPWYDAYQEHSSLILSLESPDLVSRCLELHQEGVVREFYNGYYPYLTIIPDMPQLSRNYKTFILSTVNALCKNERPLQLTSEFIEEVDLNHVPNYEYYLAQVQQQQQRGIPNTNYAAVDF